MANNQNKPIATKMAYNIYSNPDLSKTSRQFDAFTIEFRGTKTPYLTYWALCNFGLGFTPETQALFPEIKGGGAYAGLQNVDKAKGRKAIMAFWEMAYKDAETGEDKILTASRVYPRGENTFGGEGEGTNCIRNYEWHDNKWYRMLLRTWEDAERGTTFVGQWVEEKETGKWTLISYFDTHLKDSYLKGAMSLFQENFVNDCYNVREFNAKAMYVVDHETKEWVSLDTTTIQYGNGGADNKEGGHDFGANEEFFWGQAGGEVKDQEAYNAVSKDKETVTIIQAAEPEFGVPALEIVNIKNKSAFTKDKLVAWGLADNSTPQLEYKVQVFDIEGNEIFTKSETRPEVTCCILEGVETDVYRCRITVTDIFGNETVLEKGTKEYEYALCPELAEIEAEEEAAKAVAPAKKTLSKEAKTGLIVAGSVAAAALIGAAVAGIIVYNKKKK
ncbi:MAG: DUF3472 domain-containing protein [Ruminococcaceae bacterium]|nr:DUF3472 domain-containing protein [Oscillospiraceae bacterium]